jgi:phosphoglycolate phosphatase-like HAD superfamily hydrolase
MEMLTTEMGQSLPPDLRGRLLQGSKELLTLMSTKEDVCLTLATGTLGATAEIILERCGLDAYFPVGAFGHECYSRQELIQLAKKRAIEYFALDPMLTLVVTIGDAPSDIEAGKAIGARTVSVASSSFSMEELSRFKPDVQLESFTDVEKAFISILGDGYPFTRAENVDSKE